MAAGQQAGGRVALVPGWVGIACRRTRAVLKVCTQPAEKFTHMEQGGRAILPAASCAKQATNTSEATNCSRPGECIAQVRGGLGNGWDAICGRQAGWRPNRRARLVQNAPKNDTRLGDRTPQKEPRDALGRAGVDEWSFPLVPWAGISMNLNESFFFFFLFFFLVCLSTNWG